MSRTCDQCRSRKVPCNDSQATLDGKCDNCTHEDLECTYNQLIKKRGPPKAYIDGLETRHRKLEELIRKLFPDADFSEELGPSIEPYSWSQDRVPGGDPPATANRASPARVPSPEPPSYIPTAGPSHLSVSGDNGYEPIQLLENKLSGLSLEPSEDRFMGESSTVHILQQVKDFGSEYAGREVDERMNALRRGGETGPLSEALQQWELSHDELSFPEPDLMREFINLFFEHIHIFVPILHRPTFEKAIADGLHFRDKGFAGVALLVCATGSRHSDDPRALLEGTNDRHSAGWKWFVQVRRLRRLVFGAPRLYDLQMSALSLLFMYGCSPPQACWIMAGVTIRQAQEVGAHRKTAYASTRNVIDEMWKRAFWSIVFLDRLTSGLLGRPCAMQDEDMDVDLPVECDDEYWDNPDPSLAFQQPPGKPPNISYFIYRLKLNQIQNIALRTLYATNRSKHLRTNTNPRWEQDVVIALDSELNKFIDSLPDHLRWDPTHENLVHLKQSACLYASYYAVQILVHRPFIMSTRKSPLQSFPSLAICTNAARACSHVLDIMRRRTGIRMSPNFQVPAFVAGIFLLVSVWGRKKSGMSVDTAKEMKDVHLCMQVLKDSEERWPVAGRLVDLLSELAFAGGLPPLQPSPPSLKRGRNSEDASSRHTASSSYQSSFPDPSSMSSPSNPIDIMNDGSGIDFGSPEWLPPPVDQMRMFAAAQAPTMSHTSAYSYATLPEHSEELQHIPADWRSQEFQPMVQEPSLDPLLHFYNMQDAIQTPSFGHVPLNYANTDPFLPDTTQIPPVGSMGGGESLPLDLSNFGDLPPDPNLQPNFYPDLNVHPHPKLPISDQVQGIPNVEDVLQGMPELGDDELRAMWVSMPAGVMADNWRTYISKLANTTSDTIYSRPENS